MPASVPQSRPSQEVQTLDRVRLVAAKAQLESPAPSTAVDHSPLDRLSRIVESALVLAHGSQKSAAIEIACDQSQMKRQLRLGTFDLRQQAAAGDAFLATLGAALVEEYGTARKSKKQIAREQIPHLLALMMTALEDAE